MSIEFIEYPDREMLALSLANRIAGQLGQHLRVSNSALLCVPGGSTPGPVFDGLSASDIDWPRVTVVLNDERWVDGENLRSNTRLLRRHLLTNRAAQAQYLNLYTGDATPEDAIPALEAAITPLLPITVLLLGMGNDMHTASLFPDQPETAAALAADAPPLIAVHRGDEARLSLTAPILKTAINAHLLIMGPDKRAAFEAAQNLPPLEAPIRAFTNDLTVHWAE